MAIDHADDVSEVQTFFLLFAAAKRARIKRCKQTEDLDSSIRPRVVSPGLPGCSFVGKPERLFECEHAAKHKYEVFFGRRLPTGI